MRSQTSPKDLQKAWSKLVDLKWFFLDTRAMAELTAKSRLTWPRSKAVNLAGPWAFRWSPRRSLGGQIGWSRILRSRFWSKSEGVDTLDTLAFWGLREVFAQNQALHLCKVFNSKVLNHVRYTDGRAPAMWWFGSGETTITASEPSCGHRFRQS